jgi:hypothetical protein
MKPVNEKSLLHHLFEQMDKLDKKEISADEANAQAKLASTAISLYKQELDRARLTMELQSHAEATGKVVELRELSSKGFDDTTK